MFDLRALVEFLELCHQIRIRFYAEVSDMFNQDYQNTPYYLVMIFWPCGVEGRGENSAHPAIERRNSKGQSTRHLTNFAATKILAGTLRFPHTSHSQITLIQAIMNFCLNYGIGFQLVFLFPPLLPLLQISSQNAHIVVFLSNDSQLITHRLE